MKIALTSLYIRDIDVIFCCRYTKNLLSRKCTGCHNLPFPANINNIPVYQQQQLVSQPHFVSVSGHQLKNISPPSSHLNNISLQQKNIYPRPSKNVTVNPLPPPTITFNNQNQFKCSSKLMSTIKQSEESQASRSCADNSISNPDYEINQTSLDEVERGPSEPIYAEIKGKETNQEEKSNSETSSAKPGEHQENGKKEIEYWQITAKEVVKFRPCTETFIVRE